MVQQQETQWTRAVAVPIDVREWMWSADGLALRGCCELLTYAAIYGAAESGLVFSATCGRLAGRIGFPRETVQRALARLREADLVWSPCRRAGDGRGGRPPRVYACCSGPMRRAQEAVGCGDARIEVPVPPCVAACAKATSPDPTSGADWEPSDADADDGTAEGLRTASQNPGPSFQHLAPQGDVPEGFCDGGAPKHRDATSPNDCDGERLNHGRHIAGNGPSPADTGVFDAPHVLTCHVSKDMGDMTGNVRVGEAPAGAETVPEASEGSWPLGVPAPGTPTQAFPAFDASSQASPTPDATPPDVPEPDVSPLPWSVPDETPQAGHWPSEPDVSLRNVPDASPQAGHRASVPDNTPQTGYRSSVPDASSQAGPEACLPDALPQAGPAASALTEADRAAFRELLARSLLPVDREFVGRNLEAFASLVSSGVPADAILSAYGEYARYQRERRRDTGEMRPMHLLRWLTQSPNNNILFVLRRRDEALAKEAARRERWGVSKGERPSHEDPLFTRCRDRRGTLEWHVNDDRGARRVRGAEGVESETRVRAIYERMYELEEAEAAERDAFWRRHNAGLRQGAGT